MTTTNSSRAIFLSTFVATALVTAGVDIGPDGHSEQSGGEPPEKTGRILKFDKEGNFIDSYYHFGRISGLFVPPHETGEAHGAAGEGVAVDADGNVYGAEGPLSRSPAGGGLTKYLR
jgi:hypothetical protein